MPIPVMVAIAGRAAGLMAALKEAEGGFASLGKSAGGVMGGLAAGGMITALGEIGRRSLEAAADYEVAMTRLDVATSATAESVKMWEHDIVELSNTTGVSSDKMADAMFRVASAGFQGADAMNVLKASVQASLVHFSDLDHTAQLLAGVMYTLEIPGSRAVNVMNMLGEAAKISAVDLEDFIGGLKNSLSTSNSFGISLAETAAAIAVMTNQLQDAASAGTYFTRLVEQLGRETPKSTRALADIGLAAQDVRNKLGTEGLGATIQMISQALDQTFGSSLMGTLQGLARTSDSVEGFEQSLNELGPAQVNAVSKLKEILGTTQALRAFLLLSGESADDFASALENIGKAGEGTKTEIDGFAQTMENFANKVEVLKTRIRNWLETGAGHQLLDALQGVLDMLDKIFSWFEAHPAVADIFTKGIVAAFILMMVPLAAAAAAMMAFAFVLGLVVTAAQQVGHFIGWVGMQIGRLFAWLRQGGDEVNAFKLSMSSLLPSLNMSWGGIPGFGSSIFGSLSNIVSSAWHAITAATSIGGAIVSTITNSSFMSAMGSVVSSMGGMVGSVISGMGSIVGSIVGGMGNVVGAVTSGFSNALGAARGFIGSFFSVGVAIIQGVWQGVLSMAGALASAAASVVRGALNAAKGAIGIRSPSRDFRDEVGKPIAQGIARGIASGKAEIDGAVSSVVQGPLSGNYSFTGGAGQFRGAGQVRFGQGQGSTVINISLDGNYYGNGGLHQAAMDIRNELLRLQRGVDLGFNASGSIRIS